MKLSTLFLCLVANLCMAQSPWNANSFKFTKDTVSLKDMTGAPLLTFTGISPQPITSGILNFPAGFSFRYGLKTFTTFAVSRLGFIRLGDNIVNNKPELQQDVIVPLCNGSQWRNITTKIIGTAPNRVFVIDWEGDMQPTGEDTKFQLWLSERIGKIEFVYRGLGGYYGWTPAIWSYKTFCNTTVLDQPIIASVQVTPNNTVPNVNYSALVLDNDSIYAKTRYTFQPDTLRPATPSGLTFSNIMAACLTAQFIDNSNNESMFQLERSDDNTTFFTEKKIYVTSPASTGPVTYNQTGLKPFWNYTYRVFSTNGFLVSDTITASMQTLMPLINGIKQIPGDYPSITALIQDVECKQMGPDLIIELNNAYNPALETYPITFSKSLQNRFIKSITIRPAAGANITWNTSISPAIFVIDSLKHLIFDGRSGGIGTSRNLTMFQQRISSKAIQYNSGADSGMINYCNLYLKNEPLFYTYYALAINGANDFTLSNSFLSTDSFSVSNLVSIKSPDTIRCQNTKIINNLFSRYRTDAIIFENGANNSIVSGNHFYQPEPSNATATTQLPYSSCVKFINTETVTVEGNYFGGSSPVWGTGNYNLIMAAYEEPHDMIHYQNIYDNKKIFIRNNKFGNISVTNQGHLNLIYGHGGTVVIDGNRFGTSDSLNSITSNYDPRAIELWLGNQYIINNFFSGFKGQYLTPIFAAYNDTVIVENNDIGGSDDSNANTATGDIHIVQTADDDQYVIYKKNQFRGWRSKTGDLTALDHSFGISSIRSKIIIDSNSIHHLQSAGETQGIDVDVNSIGSNSVTNNTIYALASEGLKKDNYGPIGHMRGIDARIRNAEINIPFSGEVQIYGNKIHSFVPVRSLTNSNFVASGISADAFDIKVFNNDISFGLNTTGQPIDTLASVRGINVSAAHIGTVEHNTIYFGGRGYVAYGIYGGQYVTNNIIYNDRSTDGDTPYYTFQQNSQGSGKNLWYSSRFSNINTLVQAFQQACNCDGSSFVGNPQLLNPTGDSVHYDLRPASGSSADGTGTPSVSAITTDIDGLNRNSYSPVDIGSHVATSCSGGPAPATISISSPSTDTIYYCSNAPYPTLTASISGGSFSQLQWQKGFNDIAGANALSYTINSLGSYRLIGKNACAQSASRIITVLNNPNNKQPSVTIQSNTANPCAGKSINIFATPVNQGSAPIYQWQVNNINTGPNSTIFPTSTLNNGDQVKLILTNTTSCAAITTATSNILTMTINPTVLPAITISGTTTVNYLQSTLLSSSITNGGTSPSYQWQDSTNLHNWQPITGGGSTKTYFPTATGNKVRCVLTSNALCANPASVLSNSLTFTINFPTAINPVAAESFGISYYPNPVTTSLIIDSLRSKDKWQTIEITSIDGKEKIINRSIINQTIISIDMSTLSSGMYYAILRRKSGAPVYLKFIKQ